MTHIFEGGAINISFDPAKSKRVTPCEQIVIIQTAQIFVDGKAVKHGDFAPKEWKFKNNVSLKDGTCIDARKGQKSPYYQGGGLGGGKHDSSSPGLHAPELGAGGNTNATIFDQPSLPDDLFKKGGTDKDKYGKDHNAKKITIKFESCAFCAKGKDCGHYFDRMNWEFTRCRKDLSLPEDNPNHLGKITITGIQNKPSKKLKEATDKWNKASGFKPCK
jgi:hypothetical protein